MPDTDEDLEFEWDLRDDLFGAIARHIEDDDRSMQVEIGPSGMGTPCVRKLGYRLAHVPKRSSAIDPNDIDELIRRAAWRPQVGRDVHADLSMMLQRLNDREASSPMHTDGRMKCKAPWCDQDGSKEHSGHKYRYLTEFDVAVGTINSERTITGHVDGYDRMRKVVFDWKIVGPKSLKDKHALCSRDEDPNPGDEYRQQAHIYARGVVHSLGLEVKRIAVVFLPMNGELKDGFVWSERYRPDIATASFKRARIIAAKIDEAKAMTEHYEDTESIDEQGHGDLDRLFAKMRTAPDYCTNCPWFNSSATVASVDGGCPGDASIHETSGRDFDGIVDTDALS